MLLSLQEDSLKAVIRYSIFIIGSIVLSILALVFYILFTGVDTSDYTDQVFYQKTLERKDSLVNELQQQQLQKRQPISIGWGMATITPDEPVRLTGKNFAPYNQVFDSVYVRTFLLDNGGIQLLLISYDLWIMHPLLAQKVRESVSKKFPEIDGIYFTANHSHTSIGGWASGLLGELAVGGNNPETVSFLVDQTALSIQQAINSLGQAAVGFGSKGTENLVMNRLDKNAETDDPLRILKFVRQNGQQGVFTTYSAHSVYMDKDINTLSADYPGPFLQQLLAMDRVDFASFSPGATGSHTPIGRKPFTHEKMIGYASHLADYFEQAEASISPEETDVLKFIEWPVDTRSPHFRISNHLRFRPWIFNLVMGGTESSISVIRIGNTVLVGLPVELSGEYYHELEMLSQSKGLNLMITTFNGWYLGYSNPERYYFTLKRAETRDMNWLGYQSGEYFVELIEHIIDII